MLLSGRQRPERGLGSPDVPAGGAGPVRWVRTRALAGVPHYGPGSYRHTFATRKNNEGASLESISNYLGHQSAQTTKRFYATLAAPQVPRGPGSSPQSPVRQAA